MNRLHRFLLENNQAYALWHQNHLHSVTHWVFFAFLAIAVTNGALLAIRTDVTDASGRSLLSAASLDGNVPEIPLQRGKKREPVQDHILVKFKTNVGQERRAQVAAKHGLREKSEIRQIGVKIMNISAGNTPEEVVQRLLAENRGDVEFAEVDSISDPDFTPNDPYFKNQWHLAKIAAPEAWDTTLGSDSVIYAVIDTGVDCTHPDLAVNCVPGWNFYDSNADARDTMGHGTSVAGSAVAIINNGIGIASLTSRPKIMPLRISQPDGGGYLSYMAQALVFAADRGARVANISYNSAGISSTVRSALQYFSDRGGVTTISAGNSAVFVDVPDNPYTLTVSATDSNDALSYFSNTGNHIDVAAPGSAIYTTANGGGYRSVYGTSFAAPITSGVVALVISVNPSLTGPQVQDIVRQSADDRGAAGWDTTFGAGRVNAARAVALACSYPGAICATPTPSPTTPPPPPADTVPPSVPGGVSALAPDHTGVELSWSASTDNVGVSGYNVYRNSALLTSTTNTTIGDTAVIEGATYSYAVSAFDTAGNISALSSPVSVTVPVVPTPSPTPTVEPSPSPSPEPTPITFVSYKVSQKTATSVTVTWSTNIPTSGFINYGTTAAFGSQVSDQTVTTSHSITLTNLTKNTKYYYEINAVDGSTTAKANSTFRSGNK